MGQTRGAIKSQITGNLVDLSINFYSDEDLNISIQDAYTDISILTQCIGKTSLTFPWISNLSYYNFVKLGINDYLATIAIFNNVTNLWLRDDLSLKDFDRIRRDWELWVGAPQFWAPSDFQTIAIAAKYMNSNGNTGAFDPFTFSSSAFFTGVSSSNSLGTFDLHYWAIAPTLLGDSDVFLIASDMQNMVANYCTGDLLEQAQEFQKAQDCWGEYYNSIESYADRVKRNCKSDLLLRI